MKKSWINKVNPYSVVIISLLHSGRTNFYCFFIETSFEYCLGSRWKELVVLQEKHPIT